MVPSRNQQKIRVMFFAAPPSPLGDRIRALGMRHPSPFRQQGP
jgi:hypothetical protein